MLGAVVELVGKHEVQWSVLLLQRAYRRDGEDALNSELLHAVDVGAEVQLRGHEAVSAAVACKECDFSAAEGADHVAVGRFAERGFERDLVEVGEALHLIKTTTANNA